MFVYFRKQLEAREKEVEEFYKSESEADGDDEDENKSNAEKDQCHDSINIDVYNISSTDIYANSDKCSAKHRSETNAVCEGANTNTEINTSSSKQTGAQYYSYNEGKEIVNCVAFSLSENSRENEKQLSEDYSFNLDDADDLNDFEKENEDGNQHLNKLLAKYNTNDNAHTHKPTKNAAFCKLNKLQMLKEKLANNIPKLSGGPDQEIDLTDVKPSGVTNLMERFMKHAYPQSTTKNKVELR